MVDSEKKSDTMSGISSFEIVGGECLPVDEVRSCDGLEIGVDIDDCTTNSSGIEVIFSPGLVCLNINTLSPGILDPGN